MPNRNTSISDRQLLEELWEHAPIGLALVDKTGAFLSANPCFCELLGYAETELTDPGRRFDFFSTIHPADRLAATQASQRVVGDSREGFGMECTQIRKAGGTARVLLSARAVKGTGDAGVQAMCVTTQPLDERPIRFEEDGGDVDLRFVIGVRDLWRANKKSCIVGGLLVFALIKVLPLDAFLTLFAKLQQIFITSP